MSEAILIIWWGFLSNASVMGSVRYDSVEQCELAKQALIRDEWMNGELRNKNVHCVVVSKAKSEVIPQ